VYCLGGLIKLTAFFIMYVMSQKRKKRVLVGLSGGVDSAVSAYLLLKQGYEVEGAFMKNWSSTAGLKVQDCPWLADRQEALRVAAFLGIPLHTLDFEKQYSKRVMDYFFKEYKAGRTPNPDVMCNKEIKFKLLYEWVKKNGFDFLATGHYAQVASKVESVKYKVESKGGNFKLSTLNFQLVRATDTFKDQTYFIYNIKTEQLPHVLFPIGGMKKDAVKKLAKKIGLPNADRKESMGLCFVGKIRLKDFLHQKLKAKPGPIMLGLRAKGVGLSKTKKGTDLALSPIRYTLIGRHSGLHNYTIGQRQGINVGGAGGPYYVVKKDLASNTLYVTNDPNDPLLEVSEVVIHSVNWITKLAARNQKSEIRNQKIQARYRHQGELVPCTIEKLKSGQYLIKFKTPQKAIASGQSVVLYSGKVCLGGGVIA
jgi:tRNA-specific 2-thiouridylase